MKKHIFILILVGFLVYSNSLFNRFVWDDEEFIVNNPAIRSIKNIPLFFTNNIDKSSAYYRPAMLTLHTIVYSLFGGQPFFFRFFQALIHLSNGVIIFLIFAGLFNKKYLTAFFLALIFLVHPANSEAVLFTSATQDPLFFLVGSTALLLIIHNQKISLGRLAIVSGLLLAGLLIKETAVIFYVLIFFYLIIFNKKYINKYLIIGTVSIWLYFFLRVSGGGSYVQGPGLFPIMRVTWWMRLLTIPKIILFYLEKFFVSWRLAIAQHWVVTTPTLIDFYFPLIISVVFFSAIIIYCLKTKNKLFIFFAFWYMIGLLPHLQLIPLNMTAAERWMYFSMIGLLGMLEVLGQQIKIKKSLKIALCIIVVCLLSVRTLVRSFDWRNDMSLFSHDIKLITPTFDLENNFGVALFRSGKINEAASHFKKSTELAPYWWVNWNNLGAVYEKKGDLPKAENYYLRAIQNGDYYLAYENYTKVLIRQKKENPAKIFLETTALKKFPDNQILTNLYLHLTNF